MEYARVLRTQSHCTLSSRDHLGMVAARRRSQSLMRSASSSLSTFSSRKCPPPYARRLAAAFPVLQPSLSTLPPFSFHLIHPLFSASRNHSLPINVLVLESRDKPESATALPVHRLLPILIYGVEVCFNGRRIIDMLTGSMGAISRRE